MKSKSFFSPIFEAPLSVRISCISLALMVASSTVICIPLAILFKEPRIMCRDPTTQNSFQCSEIIACTHQYEFTIEKDSDFSFSTDYELICEESSQKRLALTLNFLGYLLAAIVQTVILVEKSKRKLYMVLGGFGMATSMALMIVVGLLHLNFNIIGWLFFVAGFCIIWTNTYTYIYVGEAYEPSVVSFFMLFAIVLWGSTGVAYTLLGYFSNSDWRVIIGSGVIITFISTIIFWFSKGEKSDKKENDDDDSTDQQSFNMISYFIDMWPNKTIRNNFLIYTLIWSVGGMVYTVIYVELESVGGSVFFTTSFCSSLEVFCAFLSGFLIKKYKCNSIMIFCTSIIPIVFLIFIAAPISIAEASGNLIFLLIVCLLIAKFTTDVTNIMIYLNLAKAFTDKYVGLYVIVSRCFTRVLTVFMPNLNYLIRINGFHPFVFYGFVYMVIRYLLTLYKDVQSEGMEDLLNEVQVGISERMILASAHQSLVGSVAHDEILKRIQVDGVKLSDIKRSKYYPETMTNECAVMTLSTPLLKEISVSKTYNKGKISLYDVKRSLQLKELKEII